MTVVWCVSEVVDTAAGHMKHAESVSVVAFDVVYSVMLTTYEAEWRCSVSLYV